MSALRARFFSVPMTSAPKIVVERLGRGVSVADREDHTIQLLEHQNLTFSDLRPASVIVGRYCGFFIQLDVRETLQQRVKHDLSFEASEPGSEAEVRAAPNDSTDDFCRVISSRSGSSKAWGSRLPAPSRTMTSSPFGIVVPLISMSSRAVRAVSWTGES